MTRPDDELDKLLEAAGTSYDLLDRLDRQTTFWRTTEGADASVTAYFAPGSPEREAVFYTGQLVARDGGGVFAVHTWDQVPALISEGELTRTCSLVQAPLWRGRAA